MTQWDNEFIDEEVPGYFNFAKDGLGDFQFGYVRCDIDWRESERDGEYASPGYEQVENVVPINE